jgi:hypothetical protein
VLLDDARDPERVAGRLQRNLIVASKALREQRQRERHPTTQADT